jgi:SAM-dependent methyltransferase
VTTDPIRVFDAAAVRRHRARAAGLDGFEFLAAEVAGRLAERLDEVGSRRFPLALDLGSGGGALGRAARGRGGIEGVVSLDPAEAWLRRGSGERVAGEAEFLPFAPGAFDLVMSHLALHWVDDLPGALLQVRRALRPDGLFLAAMLGGETLAELREVLLEAELVEEGGAGPRVSPFADMRDLGGLLQRAGFALPVVDGDTLTVTYADAFALMRDLRGMGETNAVRERRRSFTRRGTLFRAAALYRERYGQPDGRIPATFQVIYLTGWAPHESQPKPLRPGSAAARLADALNATERPAGEKAPKPI